MSFSTVSPFESFLTTARREVDVQRGNRGAADPMIERLRLTVPFDGFAFSGLDLEDCRVGKGLFLSTSFPDAFTQLYAREDLMASDPLLLGISENNPIVQWHDVDIPEGADHYPRLQTLMKALKEFQIPPRTTFTFWSRGRLYGSATFTRRNRFDTEEIATLHVLSRAVHFHLSRPIVDAVNRRMGLTKGEILCLRWAGDGLTSEQVARQTGYANDTVNTYLKAATRKLGASNRTQAIAEAIRRGIIE